MGHLIENVMELIIVGRCLYVPQVPGSVKNPHNNNWLLLFIRILLLVLTLKVPSKICSRRHFILFFIFF